METKLYYFTGTGNSLAAARRLASGLKASPPVPVVQLLDRAEIDPAADVVGLVYPVHHWGPTDIVLRLARLLQTHDDTYIFAVATYGNHSGRAFQDLDRALGHKGHGLDAGYHLRTVQNYVPVFPMPNKGTVSAVLSKADVMVDRIIKRVKARSKGEREHWWYRPDVRMYYLSSKRNLHNKDRHFTVTSGCDSCGICARVCPVGNIEIRDERPVWLHRCEQCFACIHWCPQEAIEWGSSTRGMGRYHHPEVTVEDMEEQVGTR
jgi:ferredoxin